MSKKLTANGRWESSRMMLPEHREAILRHNEQRGKIKRPTLDQDEFADIERTIAESIEHGMTITLRLFDPFDEDLRAIGVIERVEPQKRRVKIDGEWFRIDDVLSAEMADGAYR